VKPKSLFGKMTRRQKAMYKKFHAKVVANLGVEEDGHGNTRTISRTVDIYFDDMNEMSNLIYDWKYESWMDMKEKFDGDECRGWRMRFEKFPFMRILPSNGDGRNTNRSFRGSVTDAEVSRMFSEESGEVLTHLLWTRWNVVKR
jgi:hypothetical protein